MLVELSIVPLGRDVQWSDQLAEALKLVDASGLPYVLTPSGTCIEGEWDEVMALVRQCQECVRRSSPHVLTSIQIEDEEGGRDKLTRNIASIEEKLGRPLRKLDPEARARPRPKGRPAAPEEPSMDRARFDTRADQLRAYARDLQATAEGCAAQAIVSVVRGTVASDSFSPAKRGRNSSAATAKLSTTPPRQAAWVVAGVGSPAPRPSIASAAQGP